MPRLAAKTEGRGNGIKTNVLNITELASALLVSSRLPHTDIYCQKTSLPYTHVVSVYRCHFQAAIGDHQSEYVASTSGHKHAVLVIKGLLSRTRNLNAACQPCTLYLCLQFFGIELGAQCKYDTEVRCDTCALERRYYMIVLLGKNIRTLHQRPS